jgi:hypothetical protein
MSVITFDTLKFVERLEKAGIPREHAKAEAEALADVLSAGTQELATKSDMSELMHEVKINRWMLAVVLGLYVATFAKLYF